MKQTIAALFLACILCGCATKGTRLTSAPPMPAESIGLFLEIKPRKGPNSAPFTVLCNVYLRTLHNTSAQVWKFPRTNFYAEKDGEFFALRRVETHSGGISKPYSISGLSVTLPRPPESGKWRIFATQEHSETVYSRHLKSHPEKTPLVFAGDQDESTNGMWTKPLVSNSITVEFSEIDDEQMKTANRIIQGLIEAEQYDPDFKKPKKDPTRRSDTPMLPARFPKKHSHDLNSRAG